MTEPSSAAAGAALAIPALTTTPTAAAATTTPARRIHEFFNLTSCVSRPVHLLPHHPPPCFQSASIPLPPEVGLDDGDVDTVIPVKRGRDLPMRGGRGAGITWKFEAVV